MSFKQLDTMTVVVRQPSKYVKLRPKHLIKATACAYYFNKISRLQDILYEILAKMSRTIFSLLSRRQYQLFLIVTSMT